MCPRREAVQRGQRVLRQPQPVQPHHGSPAVEDAQHHALAVQRGERAHAHVELALLHAQPHAPVLWQPPFRDVQLRHDLEAADHRRPEVRRRRRRVVQHAVEAVPDTHGSRLRLEVYVARSRRHRLREQQVHQPHHRRLVRQLLEIVRERLVAGDGTARVQPRDELRCRLAVPPVRPAHHRQQPVLGQLRQLDRLAEERRQLRQSLWIRSARVGHDQPAALAGQRQETMLFQVLLRHGVAEQRGRRRVVALRLRGWHGLRRRPPPA